MIVESEYVAVLNALSAHCYTPVELEENGYIIHPYDPLHYSNLRKCKRCNSKEKNAVGRECIFHREKRNKWNLKRPHKCCTDGGRGSSAQPKFLAVALDCEMAGVAGGASEAILLCVADYFTGATLLGWEGARSELWKYIDSNTIIVGHALEHDLDALRIIHPRIVDSGILSRKAVGIHRIWWGLQTLCSELVHVEIRKNKGAIYDCLEDVLATRAVVLFCTQEKEAFQAWAEVKKAEELRLEKERESRRQKKQSRKDDEGEELLYWSDIAEDLGWLHPDTGYDPWLD
ncbi:hypothetical protein GQ44DRAFT_732584 [Phaeosphaeriaceae sp. PMI808]|nr:hypothetical protein GQ44DRAFT_732584 [Phaeosphaeriaceae sp. PMI808]